jgi:DNA polymerase-1
LHECAAIWVLSVFVTRDMPLVGAKLQSPSTGAMPPRGEFAKALARLACETGPRAADRATLVSGGRAARPPRASYASGPAVPPPADCRPSFKDAAPALQRMGDVDAARRLRDGAAAAAGGLAKSRYERSKQLSARASGDPAPAPYASRVAPGGGATDLASSPRAAPAAAARVNGFASAGLNGAARAAPAGIAAAPPAAPPLAAAAPAAPAPLRASPPAAAPTPAAAAASAAAAAALSDGDEDEDAFDAGLSDAMVDATYANVPPPDVHVVNSLPAARAALAVLMAPELADATFACDTEVSDIDVAKQSPVCHGRVICFSVCAGPHAHLAPGGPAPPAEGAPRSMLWVDTWLDGDPARAEEAAAIMATFAPFWGDASRKKVWHNYSFDRHVLERAGVPMRGFAGDTMHMARMWDSSRVGRGGYGLAALSAAPELVGDGPDAVRGKVSMKRLFGMANTKKDGTPGKLTVLPPVEELQRGEATRWRWVNYSAWDARSTWELHAALEEKLCEMPVGADVDGAVAAEYAAAGAPLATMWDVYRRLWRPFGALLTDMEAAGVAVDNAHLKAAQARAEVERADREAFFMAWAAERVPGAALMNSGSGPQVTQLLFAGARNGARDAGKAGVPLERVFKVPNAAPEEDAAAVEAAAAAEAAAFEAAEAERLAAEAAEDAATLAAGGKPRRRRKPPTPKKPPRRKKNVDITLHSVWGPGVPSPLTPEVYTPTGAPACSTPVLKALAGRPGAARRALAELEAAPPPDDLGAIRDDADEAPAPGASWAVGDGGVFARDAEAKERGFGRLYSAFSSPAEGLRACAAVDALVDASAIDTLLTNFIVPLQSDECTAPDAAGTRRVHCSLNINTETGRLSARRPNLQNQPALEKDRYRVRQAFTADRAAGRTLLVADYGQLELRILAHMAQCKSMIDAFEAGGDFHSRTALGMYEHVQAAVAAGDCLLEWEAADGGASGAAPPAPLLKDLFAVERRKAKVLNFSIAYGKTAHGLSRDWGVSVSEAQDTVDRWYADRPEVKAWQAARHRQAETDGYVCTLLGRRRALPEAARGNANKAARGHALRAAINTPIQGSAADVATAAMLRIAEDARLRELGWRLLLQVHDEVILEGPRGSADEARARVVACMRSPFTGRPERPLLVDLAVDSKWADTWYEAK